jgi:hypothetical protein
MNLVAQGGGGIDIQALMRERPQVGTPTGMLPGTSIEQGIPTEQQKVMEANRAVEEAFKRLGRSQ